MPRRRATSCGCNSARPSILAGSPERGVPVRTAAPARTVPAGRPVLVVDAAGARRRVSPELAAAMIRADRGAYVRRAHRDGTLGAAGEDVVMLSGLFSSIGKVIGGAAKGVFNAGKTVVGAVAPIAGAGAGFLIGGPAGVAVGAQIGSVVQQTVKPSDQQRIERRAAEIAEQFARAGVPISPEQAVALAQQPVDVVEAQLAAAQRQQAVTTQAQVAQQIYATPLYSPPAGAASASGGTASGGTVTVDSGGVAGAGSLPMPLLLGGAALAALVLLKK